jgi:glycosyltransferase involved in cell wall biosynthesis
MDHKISILLPVYNAMPYLRECLDSILHQSVENWELLAVNDFSNDDSGALLESYASKDDRIIVLQNTAKGIIPALRLAYAHSSGQLITRMDADDIMVSDKLETLKQILLTQGTGVLATGKVKYIAENTLGGGYLRYENWLNNLVDRRNHFEEIYRECVIPSPCWMTWRQDLDSCGAFSPDVYPEDYDLVFRFYKQGLRVVGSQEVLHYWRDHDSRSSRNDPNYANQQYFKLKVPWFLQLDRQEARPLVLWGAGKKGKTLSQMLVDNNQLFHWVCNSPSKWGHKVYGVPFESLAIIPKLNNPQIIIAVGNPDDQHTIKSQLEQWGKQIGKDYFFFC